MNYTNAVLVDIRFPDKFHVVSADNTKFDACSMHGVCIDFADDTTFDTCFGVVEFVMGGSNIRIILMDDEEIVYREIDPSTHIDLLSGAIL